LAADTRVEVHSQQRLAVVFLEAPQGNGFIEAHEAAQRALDVLAFTGGGISKTERAHDEAVQWWRGDEGVTIRAILTREIGVSISATAEVRKPDGTIREPDPVPEPEWTPALRFFRYAQVAEDTFDAYRNMFLALEAILSARVQGGPRGQREFLQHALRDLTRAGQLELGTYLAQPTVTDAVDAFLTEQYEALRCATFHAKDDRPILLPGTVEERETVGVALRRLSNLVIDLSRDVVRAPRRSGAMTPIGFESIWVSPKVGNLEIHLQRTDVEGNLDESVPLVAGYLGRAPNEDSEFVFGGSIGAASIAGRAFDRVRVSAPSGEGLGAMPFDETFSIPPVDAVGAHTLEVLVVFALVNRQQPRWRFVR